MAIGSTRTAMRWRSCRAALAAILFAGCVTTTQSSFLPDNNAPRITPDEWRQRATALLANECPRLMGTGSMALGEAGFTVYLGPGGIVREAILTRSSGDPTIDSMFGGLAAQLQFAGVSGGDRAPISAGYSCGRNGSAATLELNASP